MHLEGAILRHRVSMGRIQISTLSSSSCLAIWTVTQHDKRRGNVEATCLSYDIRRLRLRTYGGGCDGGGGSFERLGPSNPNGSLMDTVMVSWRFTVSYVRHWIKSSQKVKHVEAYPPTPPTARGSASEKTLQPANASKLQDPERGKQTKEVRPSVAWGVAVAKLTLGNVLEDWRLQFGAGFLSVQKAMVLPSVAWGFGVAKPTFWRFEGCNLELGFCQFRKQGWALVAAGQTVCFLHDHRVWRSQLWAPGGCSLDPLCVAQPTTD